MNPKVQEQKYKYYILKQKLDDISCNLNWWSIVLSALLTLLPAFFQLSLQIYICIVFIPIVVSGLISLIFKMILCMKQIKLDKEN